MQNVFWTFVGTAIGVAILANLANQILFRQRLSRQNDSTPAKPKSLLFRVHATLSAVVRETSNYSPPLSFRNVQFYLPPMGGVLIMVAYLTTIFVCCFYRFNPEKFLQWEKIAYRAGFIGVAQLPLIILLSGKRNIIGFFTGMGYERLSWLHRWTARSLLLTVLIHVGYWFTIWNKYDYAGKKMKEVLTQQGVGAGAVLLWIVVSSLGPIRGLSYEFFVVQHIISWLGFFTALYFHIPAENKIWIWLPMAFWAFDRVVRAGFLFYNNLSIFHKGKSGVLACKASFEPMDETHTRIIISNPPVSWEAGQHMVLACHPIAPLSSHPFTIASLPEDGRMEFIVHAKRGATRRFLGYASKSYLSLPQSSAPAMGRSVLIEGPYSRIRPLRQFDSVVFVAGSTGATFTVPLMRDIVQQWAGTSISSSRNRFSPPAGAVTRHIRFVWVVKKRSAVQWFATQLHKVVQDVDNLRNQGRDISVEISIYVTCDDTLTSGQSSVNGVSGSKEGCNNLSLTTSSDDEKKAMGEMIETVTSRTSSSAGEGCCCTRVVEDEDAITRPCNCASRKPTYTPHAHDEKQKQNKDQDLPLLTGRPHISNIIRKTAELARGEMAVVVCGPKALIRCTRNAAVGVSDDRAVHKGTGAQGIYVHAECFGYA